MIDTHPLHGLHFSRFAFKFGDRSMVHVLRGFVLSTALLSGFVFAPQQAVAGPLLDWLFGHRTAYYPPGYAPVVPAAPLAQTSYYAPTTSYYAPATNPVLSYRVSPYSSFYGQETFIRVTQVTTALMGPSYGRPRPTLRLRVSLSCNDCLESDHDSTDDCGSRRASL